MLDTIRENARSFAIQFAIALITVVFIFSFGPGSRGCRQSGQVETVTWAAKVNGEPVPASAFDQAYRQRAQVLRMRTGGSFGVEEARAAHLREEAMKDVVERELVAQAGEHQGLWVSDDELAKEIQDASQFQKDGAFDRETYLKWVAHVEGLTPVRFEERLRRDLLARRMYQLALGSVSVGDDELKAEFLKENEGVSVRYVKFQPGQFRAEAAASDAEIDKLLAERKADVQKKFEENRALYVQKHAVKVRRVFVPVARDATKEQEDAAKKKIDEAAGALKDGKKFEDVVAQFSEGAEAKNGGDVGWVALGESPYGRKFEEAAFKLKVGETGDAVRDPFGWQMLNVQEDRPAAEKKLEDVQRDIAREMAGEQKAKDLAKAAAEQTLAKLKAGESLESQWPKAEERPDGAAPELSKKPQTQTSDTFHAYGGIVPGIGSAPRVSAAAFALSADKRIPDAVIEEQNAWFVVELKTRTRADMSKFDTEKANLRERLIGQRKGDLRKVWADGLRRDARVEENSSLLAYETRKRSGVNAPFDDDF